MSRRRMLLGQEEDDGGVIFFDDFDDASAGDFDDTRVPDIGDYISPTDIHVDGLGSFVPELTNEFKNLTLTREAGKNYRLTANIKMGPSTSSTVHFHLTAAGDTTKILFDSFHLGITSTTLRILDDGSVVHSVGSSVMANGEYELIFELNADNTYATFLDGAPFHSGTSANDWSADVTMGIVNDSGDSSSRHVLCQDFTVEEI